MEQNRSAWDKHDWSGRRLEIIPGLPVIQQDCHKCGRTFVDEFSTGARYGVHASIFNLHGLSDAVTARWLSEHCPTERLAADAADRQTRSSSD